MFGSGGRIGRLMLGTLLALVLLVWGGGGEVAAAGGSKPELRIYHIPQYGNWEDAYLSGAALGVRASEYRVVPYILVEGGWWVKPTAASPGCSIARDGRFRVLLHTGGRDEYATKIAVFLLPKSYSPPVLLGHTSLPEALQAKAVATRIIEVPRK